MHVSSSSDDSDDNKVQVQRSKTGEWVAADVVDIREHPLKAVVNYGVSPDAGMLYRMALAFGSGLMRPVDLAPWTKLNRQWCNCCCVMQRLKK